MATARYTIDGDIPPTEVQIETEVAGGWGQPEVGTPTREPGQYFHHPVEDHPGLLFRVRHTFEEQPTENDFSDWSTPGVLIVPEPGTALQLGVLALVLAFLQRRK